MKESCGIMNFFISPELSKHVDPNTSIQNVGLIHMPKIFTKWLGHEHFLFLSIKYPAQSTELNPNKNFRTIVKNG